MQSIDQRRQSASWGVSNIWSSSTSPDREYQLSHLPPAPLNIDPEWRWEEIDHELEQLFEGKVIDSDPAELEVRLLQELDELEWEAGEEFFRAEGL